VHGEGFLHTVPAPGVHDKSKSPSRQGRPLTSSVEKGEEAGQVADQRLNETRVLAGVLEQLESLGTELATVEISGIAQPFQIPKESRTLRVGQGLHQ
jgi:hypothetical protein